MGTQKGKKKEEKIKEGKREKRYRLVLDRKVYPRFCLFGFFQWNLLTKKKRKAERGVKGAAIFLLQEDVKERRNRK